VCNLQFAFPQLDNEALARAYETLYYPAANNQPPALENAPEYEVRTFLSVVQSSVGSLRDKLILDYGCGNGLQLRIAREIGAGTVGIEQSATARAHIHQVGHGTVYANLADLKEQQDPPRFDCILMCDVVEHLREPWAELSQLREFLSPRGKLFLTTPNCSSLRSLLTGAHWDQRRNLTHFYYFSSQSLRKVLHRAGYGQVVELPPIFEYSHHGFFRRTLQRSLARCHRQGGLLFMAGL
jgi:2-polyprenyl-3-methyl-5-hydroxy-6-metoxy-1,4-benzoquinol methylase